MLVGLYGTVVIRTCSMSTDVSTYFWVNFVFLAKIVYDVRTNF